MMFYAACLFSISCFLGGKGRAAGVEPEGSPAGLTEASSLLDTELRLLESHRRSVQARLEEHASRIEIDASVAPDASAEIRDGGQLKGVFSSGPAQRVTSLARDWLVEKLRVPKTTPGDRAGQPVKSELVAAQFLQIRPGRSSEYRQARLPTHVLVTLERAATSTISSTSSTSTAVGAAKTSVAFYAADSLIRSPALLRLGLNGQVGRPSSASGDHSARAADGGASAGSSCTDMTTSDSGRFVLLHCGSSVRQLRVSCSYAGARSKWERRIGDAEKMSVFHPVTAHVNLTATWLEDVEVAEAAGVHQATAASSPEDVMPTVVSTAMLAMGGRRRVGASNYLIHAHADGSMIASDVLMAAIGSTGDSGKKGNGISVAAELTGLSAASIPRRMEVLPKRPDILAWHSASAWGTLELISAGKQVPSAAGNSPAVNSSARASFGPFPAELEMRHCFSEAGWSRIFDVKWDGYLLYLAVEFESTELVLLETTLDALKESESGQSLCRDDSLQLRRIWKLPSAAESIGVETTGAAGEQDVGKVVFPQFHLEIAPFGERELVLVTFARAGSTSGAVLALHLPNDPRKLGWLAATADNLATLVETAPQLGVVWKWTSPSSSLAPSTTSSTLSTTQQIMVSEDRFRALVAPRWSSGYASSLLFIQSDKYTGTLYDLIEPRLPWGMSYDLVSLSPTAWKSSADAAVVERKKKEWSEQSSEMNKGTNDGHWTSYLQYSRLPIMFACFGILYAIKGKAMFSKLRRNGSGGRGGGGGLGALGGAGGGFGGRFGRGAFGSGHGGRGGGLGGGVGTMRGLTSGGFRGAGGNPNLRFGSGAASHGLGGARSGRRFVS